MSRRTPSSAASCRRWRAEFVNLAELRRTVHAVVEGGARGYLPGRVFNAALVTVILVNVSAIVLGTIPETPARIERIFEWIEHVSVAVFTVEYALRIWSCVDDPRRRYAHPVRGRLRYMATPAALIDLLAVAPVLLFALFHVDAEFVVLLRVLRLLKLIHFTGAFEIIGAVLQRERRALVACAMVVSMIWVLISTLGYLAERTAQPDKFGSIPEAMYWGIITLTTVGYGDLTPVTAWGRVVSGFAVVLGVMCLAMPTGIIASGFMEEVRRRDFIVTWQLVAKVPLFARLSAARIASIASILRPLRVEPEEVVVREGDHADRMYFVVEGQLEVAVRAGPVLLHGGDFFGEMGLIEGGKRNATVTAKTECVLLTLTDREFWALVESQPEIAEEFRATAERRRGAQPQATADG
jgi:voltage-gated potassium channel